VPPETSRWLFSRRADLLPFGGPAFVSVLFLALLVPLLALPRATHDLLDARIWRGFKPDDLEPATAIQAPLRWRPGRFVHR